MTLEERSSLILAFARVLYVNGQSTDQTVAAAERFGDALGLRAKIMPRRISGVCSQHQRQLNDAIKKARNIALLPFATE